MSLKNHVVLTLTTSKDLKFINVHKIKAIMNMEDIKLLVEMDTIHNDICSHAIKKLMERAYHIYGQQEYQKQRKRLMKS
ncbi:MAG: hypothetical protein ACI87J_002213 [Colwellia sp.]|jgi:hypothetical protein